MCAKGNGGKRKMLSGDNVNYMEIKFKGVLENIVFARNTLAQFIYKMNPTISFLNELKTVVSEGVTNCIVHGYEGNIGEVILRASFNEKEIYFEIEDSGIGIPDIKQAMEPMFTTKIEDNRSGLGFTIMEIFLDSLEVVSNGFGTTLKCYKRLGDLIGS